MREIKFRAWDKQRKKMFSIVSIDFQCSELSGGRGIYLIDSVELMQFTGLCDKNGKEIYEGDIVKFDTIFSKREVENNRGTVSRVFWAGTGFYVRGTRYSCTLDKAVIIEVVGNIYENPELLKKGDVDEIK